jgi:hypothetical protein
MGSSAGFSIGSLSAAEQLSQHCDWHIKWNVAQYG